MRKILYLLKSLQDGKFHSGQDLAREMRCSRTAIWKEIKQLRAQGVPIESVTGRGYRIAGGHCLLNQEKILDSLPKAIHGKYQLNVLPIVNSTNVICAEHIKKNRTPFICIAEMQKQGRGRRGKTWDSPFAENIYCSIANTLNKSCLYLSGLSLAAGVSLAEVLHDIGIVDVKVKWPNDIYVQDKKIAGILVEIMGDIEGPCDVIVGFGINTNMRNSTQKITQPWTSITKELGIIVNRNEFLAKCITAITDCLTYYQAHGLQYFINAWFSYDYLYQKNIVVSDATRQLYGKAIGIDNNGLLQVALENDEVLAIHSGDVSVRTC